MININLIQNINEGYKELAVVLLNDFVNSGNFLENLFNAIYNTNLNQIEQNIKSKIITHDKISFNINYQLLQHDRQSNKTYNYNKC